MAKEKLIIVIRNEVIFGSTFIISSLFMISKENLMGISYSYALASILFILSNIWAYKKYFKSLSIEGKF